MVIIVPTTNFQDIFSLRKTTERGVAINGAAADIAAVVDAEENCNAKAYSNPPAVLPINPAIITSSTPFQLNLLLYFPRFDDANSKSDIGATQTILKAVAGSPSKL